MAIIRYTKDATIRYAYLNIFPDQFKTDKEKENEGWIKNTMDYFANKAYAEYIFQEPEVKSFTDILTSNIQLPSYVKHYSILTTPINELVGEVTKRPDT